MQNTGGKKRAPREDVDSAYLFVNVSLCELFGIESCALFGIIDVAHPRRFDPCKLSAIAGTRALRAQPARKSAAFKAGRRSSSSGSHGPVHALLRSEPCFLKILHRHLLAPHGAEAIATLRQR